MLDTAAKLEGPVQTSAIRTPGRRPGSASVSCVPCGSDYSCSTPPAPSSRPVAGRALATAAAIASVGSNEVALTLGLGNGGTYDVPLLATPVTGSCVATRCASSSRL